MKKRFLLILSFAASLLALPACAQVSTVKPQTNVQHAFVAAACTPATFQVLNIGQAYGSVTYTTSGTINAIRIDILGNGANSTTTAQVISTLGTNVTGGQVFANTYLPYMWVEIAACSGSGTVTADYIASSLPANPLSPTLYTSGAYQLTLTASTSTAGGANTFTFSSPTGSTGGQISFTCGACSVPWTNPPRLQVYAGRDTSNLAKVYEVAIDNHNFSLVPTSIFTVPDIAGPVVRITQTPSTDAAANYSMSYAFGGGSTPTLPPMSAPPQYNAAQGLWPQQLFKCDQEAAINITAMGAGDTTLVTGVPSKNIYVCHIDLVSTQAVTLRLDYAAAGCASSIVAITGLYPAVAASFVMDYSPYAPLVAPSATVTSIGGPYDLCLRVGGATTIGGTVIYAQGIF